MIRITTDTQGICFRSGAFLIMDGLVSFDIESVVRRRNSLKFGANHCTMSKNQSGFKKRLLLVLLLVSPFSLLCQESTSNQRNRLKDKPKLRIFYPMQIGGDFNGDGLEEPLDTQVFSRIKSKPIDSLFYDGTTADLNQQLCDVSAQLRLVSEIGIEPLVIINDCNNPSIWQLMNAGNINDAPGDEIGFVTGDLEKNTRDSCFIYTYCENSWKNIGSFKVTEISPNQSLEFDKEKRCFYWRTYQGAVLIDFAWSLNCTE